MKRITLCLCGFAGMGMAVSAQAGSLAYAVSRADGSPAGVTLLDGNSFDLAHIAAASGDRWRLGDRLAEPRREDGGDVRLRVKLRPSRAMGRVSVSF